MSSEDAGVTPEDEGKGADPTLRIRSSAAPEKSWSPAADGPGGGPTRPAQQPPAKPADSDSAAASPATGAAARRPAPGAAARPGQAPAKPASAGKPGPAGAPSRPAPGPATGPAPGARPQPPAGPGARPGQAAPSGPGGRPGQSPVGPAPGARPGGPGAKQPAPPAARPKPGTGSAQPGGLGAVSSLATPDPAPRPEQRQKATAKAPRKAHLVLRRIEPWSAMKFSFVVSLVCFVVLFVAVAVLYGVLSALGVFDSIVNTVTQLTVPDGKSTNGLDIRSWFEPARILGFTALIGAVNVVLITALATLGTVIYNVAADLVGGVEVTFSEAE
ncbi:DUF3566 domain-containing protein [Sphaerisporangium rufum]|uniref:DUF3566 domain-containing protein n=1 Tax=Sphaerisporangium rufum TaxID=1381558 RepID=UPI0027DBC39C|nr:DUF3566 domain-containing protein [Sphaerisporangium rufum]